MFFHGFGVSLCPARGLVSFNGGPSHDAVECVTFLFMPIVPVQCLHVPPPTPGRRAGASIPIRWSLSLIARAFGRRWFWGCCVITLLAIAAWGDAQFKNNPAKARRNGQMAIITGLIALSLRSVLKNAEQRDSSIRLLLGPHTYGTSDPVSWPKQWVAQLPTASEMYGQRTFSEAVPWLLNQRQFSRAMLAARLSLVSEDNEAATETVLDDPEVQAALEEVRADITKWPIVMTGAVE